MTISIGLEIQHDWIHKEFETILAAQEGFYLQHDLAAGFPDLLILEMSSNDPIESGLVETLARVEAVQSASPTTEIFLTCFRTDPLILLEAIRAGVKEFFPQPIKREEVERALKKFQARYQTINTQSVKRGRLVTVMGSKGGVGTTTLAVNVASGLLEAGDHTSVVLVDLNPQFGDVALFLDIEPSHTMNDLAKNLNRLDQEFLGIVLAKHASGLHVLPSANIDQDLSLVTPENVERILKLLQTMYDYVVIDNGHSLDDITLTAARLAQSFFLICTFDLPTLRNTKRLLDVLCSNFKFSKENVRIIGNRYKSKYQEISLQEFEKVIGTKIFFIIPNDYYTISRAINKGETLSISAKRARLTKSIKKLSASLLQETDGKEQNR